MLKQRGNKGVFMRWNLDLETTHPLFDHKSELMNEKAAEAVWRRITGQLGDGSVLLVPSERVTGQAHLMTKSIHMEQIRAMGKELNQLAKGAMQTKIGA